MSLFNLLGVAIAQGLIGGIGPRRAVPFDTTSTSSAAASRASSKADQVKAQLKVLESNLAKAMLINESMWEIMRDKFGITDQELYKKVHEIDMRDGSLDGKNQRKAIKCPSCNHMVSRRHAACLYCGEIVDRSVFAIN